MNDESSLLFIPLFIQGAIMLFDEFYFHHKRGLPKWEVIGHPLDTITVIAPLLYALSFAFNDDNAIAYAMMALFSCIFVVKDELIHKELCSKGEMILHALLFIFHPLVFLSIFLFWQSGEGILFGYLIGYRTIIAVELGIMVSFLIYQIVYWGVINDKSHQQRNI